MTWEVDIKIKFVHKPVIGVPNTLIFARSHTGYYVVTNPIEYYYPSRLSLAHCRLLFNIYRTGGDGKEFRRHLK